VRETETSAQALLQSLEDAPAGPAVAAIGGGHGLAQALKAIQLYTTDISAIVGVADNGGSSGRLAPALGIPPPGDIRRCLLALSPEASRWRDMFEFRFSEGDVEGHSLGNLIIAALAERAGDFDLGVIEAARSLGALGTVIPVATEAMHLRAEIGGVAVEGQLAIAQTRGEITGFEIEPPLTEANARALDAVMRADHVVLGPGSLFTSTMAPLLVGEMVQAVNQTEATLVYVFNLITQDGETLGMTADDHLEALAYFAKLRRPDVIVANDGPLTVQPPHQVLRLAEAPAASELINADLVDHEAEWPMHEPHRLGTVLAAIGKA